MRLAQLSNDTLRTRLHQLTATDCTTTANLLAHLGEFDARRLYAEEGFSSMFVYCVQHLCFSEDVAFKRIRAARVARRFPCFLRAVAQGRVHLTAVVLLGPHLNRDNARELLAVATHKTKKQIEKLLAERFPQDDVGTFVRALPRPVAEVVPGPPRIEVEVAPLTATESFVSPAPAAPPTPARVTPLAPRRYALQTTLSQETHDKLCRIQELLGPPGDVAQVLDRAFDALLVKLEKTKCGATGRPRCSAPKPSTDPRYISNSVKREVRTRDGNQCAFVSDSGEQCIERRSLEYDHVLEVARGGTNTADNIRLLCRTHNQLMADRAFGRGFMQAKRARAAAAQGALGVG